jgi:hypothetical protein
VVHANRGASRSIEENDDSMLGRCHDWRWRRLRFSARRGGERKVSEDQKQGDDCASHLVFSRFSEAACALEPNVIQWCASCAAVFTSSKHHSERTPIVVHVE